MFGIEVKALPILAAKQYEVWLVGNGVTMAHWTTQQTTSCHVVQYQAI